MSSIPSTPPRPDALDQPSPFHIISTQLITLLISLLSNLPLVTHSVDVFTQLFLIVSISLVSTTSSEQRKSSARNPLHGLRATAFTTRLMQESTSSWFSPLAAAHDTLHPVTELIPIRFISFHILSLVSPFVPMSAMFDSVGTGFVANFFSSMACPRCGGISQHPAVSPCHDSQLSHSGAQVSSSSLPLRDRCVSSTDLSLPRILARGTLTRL